MDIYALAERAMGMDDRVWLRHANPWSVWTRIVTTMPLFILVGFSRQWLGWGALALLAVVLLWVWANPRLFLAPRDLGSWAAQGVLGERVFLRKRHLVAAHHLRAAKVLTVISALGMIPFAWGLVALDLPLAVLGGVIVSGAKTWFVDRMVWVWQDFQSAGHGVADLTLVPAT